MMEGFSQKKVLAGCEICGIPDGSFSNKDQAQLHFLGKRHQRAMGLASGGGRVVPSGKRKKIPGGVNNIHCDVCNSTMRKHLWEMHMKNPLHHQRVAAHELQKHLTNKQSLGAARYQLAPGCVYCSACGVSLNDLKDVILHAESETHREIAGIEKPDTINPKNVVTVEYIPEEERPFSPRYNKLLDAKILIVQLPGADSDLKQILPNANIIQKAEPQEKQITTYEVVLKDEKEAEFAKIFLSNLVVPCGEPASVRYCVKAEGLKLVSSTAVESEVQGSSSCSSIVGVKREAVDDIAPCAKQACLATFTPQHSHYTQSPVVPNSVTGQMHSILRQYGGAQHFCHDHCSILVIHGLDLGLCEKKLWHKLSPIERLDMLPDYRSRDFRKRYHIAFAHFRCQQDANQVIAAVDHRKFAEHPISVEPLDRYGFHETHQTNFQRMMNGPTPDETHHTKLWVYGMICKDNADELMREHIPEAVNLDIPQSFEYKWGNPHCDYVFPHFMTESDTLTVYSRLSEHPPLFKGAPLRVGRCFLPHLLNQERVKKGKGGGKGKNSKNWKKSKGKFKN